MSEMYVPRTQRGIFGNIVAWGVALLIVGGVITGVIFGIRTLTAPIAGQAGAFRQQQGATNRVFAQATFEQENADIDGYIAKIAVAKDAIKADPSTYNRTNLIGAEQQCIDTVQQYDADSAKYLLRDFKSAGLPPSRNPEECK